MKLSNFRNESNSDGTKDTNNSAKWTLGSTRQELIGKIEEPKQQEAETPNPKKAPLNYIENMWEWESTQKKTTGIGCYNIIIRRQMRWIR